MPSMSRISSSARTDSVRASVQSAYLEVPMSRIIPVVLCALLGIVLTGETIPDQVNGQPEISTEKLVGAMRTLNTVEVSSYVNENRRYADRDQLLAYPAVFSDDKGVIFLGQGLGCEETPQKP